MIGGGGAKMALRGALDDIAPIGQRLRYKELPGRSHTGDNRGDCDTERIPAGVLGVGRWALLGVLGSTSVLPPTDVEDGVKLEICNTVRLTDGSRKLLRTVARGLLNHQEPQRTTGGLGGTYFFPNELGRSVAIFKPCDEEPMAPCNPGGFIGRRLGDPGLKPTVRVGEAALREVAVYLLDRERFAGVPHTVLVNASHPKFHYLCASEVHDGSIGSTSHVGEVELSGSSASSSSHPSVCSDALALKLGSLQEYVSHFCDTCEMGTSKFNTRNVHRIGILDIRLYNTDRHAGNILVRSRVASTGNLRGLARLDEGQFELIPIDHGFCLPEGLEPPYFEWLHWPQALLPFGEDELHYISNLDVEADKALLRQELPILREECLRTLEVSTILLKKCAAAGLCLHEIGEVMSRPLVGIEEEPSALEKVCMAAKRELEGFFAGHLNQIELDPELELAATANPYKTSSFYTWWSASDSIRCMDSGDLETSAPDMGTNQPANDGCEMLKSSCIQRPRRCGLGDKKRSASLQLPSSYLPGRRTMLGSPFCHRKLLQQPGCPKQCLQPQAYPPPVEGATPSSANDIFRGMDDCQWELFIKMVEDRIDQALNCGCWSRHTGKQGRYRSSLSSVGLPCSKFYYVDIREKN